LIFKVEHQSVDQYGERKGKQFKTSLPPTHQIQPLVNARTQTSPTIWLIDWLVFNANFSNISAVSWREQTARQRSSRWL